MSFFDIVSEACSSGDNTKLTEFLSNNPNAINNRNDDARTAFDIAKEYPEIMAILNQYLLRFIFNNAGDRNEEVITNILADHPDQVHNILRAASIFGWKEMVLHAMGNGADPSYAPQEQNNAFHNAIARGHVDIIQYFININPGIIHTLNGEGFSALRNAVRHEQYHAVNLLLDYGAGIYVVDAIDGRNPLYDARNIGGEVGERIEMVNLLMSNNLLAEHAIAYTPSIDRVTNQGDRQMTVAEIIESSAAMAQGSEMDASAGLVFLLGLLFTDIGS